MPDVARILAVVMLLIVLGAMGMLVYLAAGLKRQVGRMGQELAEAHAQLARAQKLGSLGEMASSFAHAFNDVLTPIIGRIHLLSQRTNDPVVLEWLQTIERTALEGAGTVRRIQDFMRIQRAEPAVAVDLVTVARQAAMAAAPRVPPGVKIDVDPEEVPPVAGDPIGLREAVTHVIVNAAEATPVGGRVTVAVRAQDGEAIVVVTDHGEGMSPEIKGRVFEPFFTTRPQATGLGLCLTHAIVSRHGGSIEIESEGGKGTTVTMRLPAQTAGRARGAAAAAPTGPSGPARCLVVDDDPQVRDMLRDVLRNGGHTVVTAVDGADGVDKFKAQSFDIVITDLAMPRLNGLQLTRVCKTLRPHVPVLMLTGWGVMLTEAELAEHGVDEVVSKPVRMEAVLTTVAALRARPVAAEEVAAT